MSEQRVSAAEDLAMRFHEAYERLAPSFGDSTREASAKPWAEVPLNNKALMIAVCHELLGVDGRSTVATLRAERDELRRVVEDARATLPTIFDGTHLADCPYVGAATALRKILTPRDGDALDAALGFSVSASRRRRRSEHVCSIPKPDIPGKRWTCPCGAAWLSIGLSGMRLGVWQRTFSERRANVPPPT